MTFDPGRLVGGIRRSNGWASSEAIQV